MKRDLNMAVIKIPLMEIDDDLRGLLLAERSRCTGAIATHLYLRVRRHYRFRRNSGEASLGEVVEGIADAIWDVPQRVLADFANGEPEARAAATDVIAKEVFRALTDAFEPIYVPKPYGEG